PRHLPQLHAGEQWISQCEQAKPQQIAPFFGGVAAQVAQPDQRAGESRDRGPGNARAVRNIAIAQPAFPGPECGQHINALGDGGGELRVRRFERKMLPSVHAAASSRFISAAARSKAAPTASAMGFPARWFTVTPQLSTTGPPLISMCNGTATACTSANQAPSETQ